MTHFSVSEVRELAEEFGYDEIVHNEVSKMISFLGRYGLRTGARINVYYSTGTVGSCLNHPKQGKTQLFRRDVDLAVLEKIFDNPRLHSGKGYHRKKQSQRWKHKDSYQVDSARRWLFVGTATGAIRSDQERNHVKMICTKFEELYGFMDSPPDVSKTSFGCGSRGPMTRMLIGLMREMYDEVMVGKTYKLRQFHKGMLSHEKVEAEHLLYNHECDAQLMFMKECGRYLMDLKRSFKLLRNDLRVDLIQWFLERDSQVKCVSGYDEYTVIKTAYSDMLDEAHVEYGELMYPEEPQMCLHCGVYSSGS